jgi:hypothetical protein
MTMILKAERINVYDVIVTGRADGFIKALEKSGLRTWKLSDVRYQVSFANAHALRAALPPVGTIWEIIR